MPDRKPLDVRMRQRFPLADDGSWEQTSEATDAYNCAAWAVEVTDGNWWPEPDSTEYYWPQGIVRDGSVEAFVAGYSTLGYEVCADGEREDGFGKLVLYATSTGSPQHVARQLADGRWSSKLGDEEDIVHAEPSSLSASRYGNPRLFMRRRTVVEDNLTDAQAV